MSASYPLTRRDSLVERLHNVEVPDPYRWLENAAAPDVQAWMNEQDAVARSALRQLPERDAIAARLKELYYLDATSPPTHRGNRYFYRRRFATKEKAVVAWREGKAGAEHVLLDPNTWSKDGSVSLGGWSVSWDGTKVAYQVKANNSDEAVLQVLDVATGKELAADRIEGAKYAHASWTPAGDGFYYTWLPTDPAIPAAQRPGHATVRFHRLGTDPSRDPTIRAASGDPTQFVGATLSPDGHWLVLSVQHGWTSTDVYFRDARREGEWQPLVVGVAAHFDVAVWKDVFYVTTDDHAPRGRLFRVDPAHADRARWKEIVPERPDATLQDASVLGGRLVLSYLKKAASELQQCALDGSSRQTFSLPGLGTVDGPHGRPDDDEIFYGFQSYTTPPTVYARSLGTGAATIFAQVSVPVDSSPYLVEQVTFSSKDGTPVTMFLVRRRDAPRDGSNRLLLEGYGGFQVSLTPSFLASIYPWLERGGLYASVNLRGGGEYGEAWHQDGMLLNKQHTFDDFIAAAEYLTREGYTRPERLVARGGSNGGLLMGAVLTQRPELFGAILCSVPLLDMVRYHRFGSGTTWISEYGSADDAAQFRVLYGYSPYHHVRDGIRYPATLLLSADSDDRVDPLHARKFAAALQHSSTGGPVLLRIERQAGHGGADLVRAAVDAGADAYAFALQHTGR